MFKYGLFALMMAAIATVNVAQGQSQKGPNGGMVVLASGHPIEFVVKGQDIAFYLRDNDGKTPLTTKTMQGRATVQDSGKATTVTLQPAEPNITTGKLAAPLGSKARVVFSATFRQASHNHTLTARYVTE